MVNFFRYIIRIFLFYTFLFSYDKSIDVITTNDLHGSLDLQKAYFINPSNPPDIIGASGFAGQQTCVPLEKINTLIIFF